MTRNSKIETIVGYLFKCFKGGLIIKIVVTSVTFIRVAWLYSIQQKKVPYTTGILWYSSYQLDSTSN